MNGSESARELVVCRAGTAEPVRFTPEEADNFTMA